MDQPHADRPIVAIRPEDTAESTSPAAAPAPPAHPLIVVQYRRNWSASLLPPILIILIAVVILQSRMSRTPPAPPQALALAPVAVPSVDANPRGPSHLASPSPVVVIPPPPTTAEVKPPEPEWIVDEPPPAIEKPADRPPPSIGFVRPGDRGPAEAGSPFDLTDTAASVGVDRREGLDVLPPKPPAEDAPGQEEVIAASVDVEPTPAEEALAIREHREALAGMKDRLQEADRRLSVIRKAEEAQQLKVSIEEKRVDFLRELRRTLKERGATSGPEIVALCARYGRAVPKESEIRAQKILKTANGYRLEPKARVELLRSLGWPEAMILDELAHGQAREIGRRNGPRNRAEALTTAARILLSVPLQRPTASLGPNARPNPSGPIR